MAALKRLAQLGVNSAATSLSNKLHRFSITTTFGIGGGSNSGINRFDCRQINHLPNEQLFFLDVDTRAMTEMVQESNLSEFKFEEDRFSSMQREIEELRSSLEKMRSELRNEAAKSAKEIHELEANVKALKSKVTKIDMAPTIRPKLWEKDRINKHWDRGWGRKLVTHKLRHRVS